MNISVFIVIVSSLSVYMSYICPSNWSLLLWTMTVLVSSSYWLVEGLPLPLSGEIFFSSIYENFFFLVVGRFTLFTVKYFFLQFYENFFFLELEGLPFLRSNICFLNFMKTVFLQYWLGGLPPPTLVVNH